jgi:type II secretory pathway component HofQ
MKIKIFLVLGTVIVLVASASWAELTSSEKASSTKIETKSPPTISMDFKDANLKDILKIFSQQSGLNFIASEDIAEKKVTLYLDNVSVTDALNSIIAANNLTY